MNFGKCDPWLFVLLLLITGCGKTPSASPPAEPPERSLSQGTKVKLIKEATDYALVECEDGQQAYVPLGLLKHRDTSKRGSGAFTHLVVRDTPVSNELPSQAPVPLEPRNPTEIDQEQRELNSLFLTEKTGKRVIAPRNVARSMVDDESGERAWHAYECTNPECPGEKPAGQPYHLFIHIIGEQEMPIECPVCAALRNRAAETREQAVKWGSYVRPYELPETVRRRTELDDERRRYVETLRGPQAPQ